MATNTFFDQIFEEIKNKGFTLESSEGYINFVKNEAGEYVGDLLEKIGFKKIIETDNLQKTWVEFELEGQRFLGHRDIEQALTEGHENGTFYLPYLQK